MRLCILALVLLSCAHPVPYKCGPTMDQKNIQRLFNPLINLMGIKAGDSFADVGASSGGFTIMMSTLFEGVNVYVQDIDTACLNKTEFDKVVAYYSRQSGHDLLKRNRLHFVVGESNRTHLPSNSMDCIYTNATFHQFTSPDSIIHDLHTKLKSSGKLYIRDSLQKGDSVEYCSDPKCDKRLVRRDTLLAVLMRQGFTFEHEQNFSGYPLFTFSRN